MIRILRGGEVKGFVLRVLQVLGVLSLFNRLREIDVKLGLAHDLAVRLSRPRARHPAEFAAVAPPAKLCEDIDERVQHFLERPLAGEWPYSWLDATYLKQRARAGRLSPSWR